MIWTRLPLKPGSYVLNNLEEIPCMGEVACLRVRQTDRSIEIKPLETAGRDCHNHAAQLFDHFSGMYPVDTGRPCKTTQGHDQSTDRVLSKYHRA